MLIFTDFCLSGRLPVKLCCISKQQSGGTALREASVELENRQSICSTLKRKVSIKEERQKVLMGGSQGIKEQRKISVKEGRKVKTV